jgi:hypothetical protein
MPPERRGSSGQTQSFGRTTSSFPGTPSQSQAPTNHDQYRYIWLVQMHRLTFLEYLAAVTLPIPGMIRVGLAPLSGSILLPIPDPAVWRPRQGEG